MYLLAGGLFEWTLTVHGRSLAIASLFSLRVSLLFVSNRLMFGAVWNIEWVIELEYPVFGHWPSETEVMGLL